MIRKTLESATVTFVILALMAVLPWMAGRATADEGGQPAAAPAAPALAEKWGIEVVGIRLAASSYMVDFRYKVLDAGKAATLFDRSTQPALLHQPSGKVLTVPKTAKVGSLRSVNNPKQGRTYWIFFGNQTRLVKSGDPVTVIIGEFKAENLTVQ